jgi:hypothetical protein
MAERAGEAGPLPSTLVLDIGNVRIRIGRRRSAAMQQAQTSTGNVAAETAEVPERPVKAVL